MRKFRALSNIMEFLANNISQLLAVKYFRKKNFIIIV